MNNTFVKKETLWGKKKHVFTLFLGVALSLSLVGCGSSAPQATGSTTGSSTTSAQDVLGVSKDKPIVVDKASKTVKIYTEVNAKYFVDPTRHAVVFKDGSNASKSILKSWANQNDFYTALADLGAKPGNNVTPDTKDAAVQGDALDVTINWNGAAKEIPIADAVIDSNNKKPDFRFGGNQDRAKSKNTGCILCLDSCPVGIASNATYPQGSFDGKKVEFRGNKDVLPADGTPVVVIFKLK